MGCDIHAYAEKKDARGQFQWAPVRDLFDWRSYGTFGFLADVRNYSAVTPIAPRKGLPDDVSADVKGEYESWDSDAHSASWLSLQEFLAFDYDVEMEDRRVMINNDGGCTCNPGEGKKMTYREFLGPSFFEDIDRLKEAGADRVVFWFDN